MKFNTFAIASALTLALFLFAQRRTTEPPRPPFAGVVDLTHSVSDENPDWLGRAKAPFEARELASFEKEGYFPPYISLPERFATYVDAPAHCARGGWTVAEIPSERLVRPLAVIDLHRKVESNADYEMSINDIADWEQANGEIAPGAVVMARTGWDSHWYSMKDYRNADAKGAMHFPGFSLDAVKFLVTARQVVGLGIDTLSVDYGPSKDFPVHHFTAKHQVYQVENLAHLERVPQTGAIAVIAPAKLEGGSGGAVRVLALLK